MRFGYKFGGLLGAVYSGGRVVFSKDGSTVVSVVGNKISVFDLVESKSHSLALQHMSGIQHLDLSPDNAILISVDSDANLLMSNFKKEVLISGMKLKGLTVGALQFSPNGKYFAVAIDNHIQIWQTPSLHKEFAPFVLYRDLVELHTDDVHCLSWSNDSQYLLSAARDNSVIIHKIEYDLNYIPINLLGHRSPLAGAFWDADDSTLYCLDNTHLVVKKWKFFDDAPESAKRYDVRYGKWETTKKQSMLPEGVHAARISCCHMNIKAAILVIGYNNGCFNLYDVPEFSHIQSLSVSNSPIDAIQLNNTGEWICLGSKLHGQLLVWEWQSETYILKQQGHTLDMRCIAYSTDGQFIATGSDDGKVKVWNTTNGFCFVTFTEHTGPVTDIAWSQNSNALFTCSSDGTVRAFDLIRYKNFRVMKATTAVQFTCVSVESSGELVCAGAQDSFDIFVWSVQTGKLLDVLAGHEGPISGIEFNPLSAVLVSASWDKKVRIWDVFESKANPEAITCASEILGIAFHPDGSQFCTWTLDAQISFWDSSTGAFMGTIEGRKDLVSGGYSLNPGAKSNVMADKHFNRVCYSSDGKCVIAGGNSRFICIYEVSQRLLLRKFSATNNRNYDSTLTWHKLQATEAGSLLLVDDAPDDERMLMMDEYIPGASKGKGESQKRNVLPTFLVHSVKFSPSGRSWCAATTEGLLIYTLDETMLFDPFELDVDVTPSNILHALESKQYLPSLVMAFKLNEKDLIKKVFENIPANEVQFVVRGFPTTYLQRLLSFLSANVENSPHLEYHLVWCMHVFNYHGRFLKENSTSFMSVFRNLQKQIAHHQQQLAGMCDDNKYSLDFLGTIAAKESAL